MKRGFRNRRNHVGPTVITNRIYLDHAATTPIRPEALSAMQDGFAIWANPSSPHGDGRRAKAALENARDRVKAALGWDGEVIFTSGASEALSIGLGRAKADRVIVSAAEHDAVFRAAPDAQTVRIADGVIDLSHLRALLSQDGRVVAAVQAVNSETGTNLLLPGQDPVTAAIREAGGLILSDCSQAAGKIAIPDVDMAVVSAHKLGGPIGIGALLIRDFQMLEPTGGHERGYRQGTENLPAAMGFAAALEAGGLESWATSVEQQFDFRNALMDLGEIIAPGFQVPYIIALAHPTASAQSALIRLDAKGISVSAGSACSSGTLKRSRALEAFGVAENVAARTIRVSIGWSTTNEELEQFAAAWASLT